MSFYTPFKKGKEHIMFGKPAWNKGKRMPHSPEWEAKRIAAVRKAALLRRGVPTGRPPASKVIKALLKWKEENKDAARALAIANLPTNISGSLNGNWKGGITLESRGLRWSQQYKDWRNLVLERDDYRCKLCKKTGVLHVHHIIAMSQCSEIALLPMNGVTLCADCHYENDEAWRGKRYKKDNTVGHPFALVFAIPHKFQAYPTVGNWQYSASGVPVVFVSKMSDERYEFLVAVHELIEVFLCRKSGVTQKQVDSFDIRYEKQRRKGDESEPGDSPKAPYKMQHCIATGVERILAACLGVCWSTYERELYSL